MSKRFKGFTLAEVLITLAIIGVVAAMTIPTLMQSYKDRQTVTAVLKAASTLTNAYKLTVVDDGEPTDWFNGGDGNSIQKLFKHLNTTKTCLAGEKHDTTCFYDGNQVSLDGTEDWYGYAVWPSASMSDGSSIVYYHHSNECSHPNGKDANGNPIYCGRIYYDINGLKSPNVIGKDIFAFALTKNGITADTTADTDKIDIDQCDMNKAGVHNGKGCTAYILKNRNVDYLHKTSN